MNQLIIANTPIRQNLNALFCLNDLHHAAGGEARHKPSEWLRRRETNELIEELAKPGISGLAKAGISALAVTKGGNTPGTWACTEMVYAYATWISPKFLLKVVRVFHMSMTGQFPAAADSLKAQLALAQEVGQLKDDMRGLQSKLIGYLESHVRVDARAARLEYQKARLQQREAVRQRLETVVRMEANGESREKIASVTGMTRNNIRQAIDRAKKSGRLPAQRDGQLDLPLTR